ncbi:MAG: zinc-finger domain-containing protein [Pseudomonadota bacterium]
MTNETLAPAGSAAATGEIEVSAKDLPLHCPTKEVALWCSHPRVFLDITETGRASCPYCGTRYALKAGEVVGHH